MKFIKNCDKYKLTFKPAGSLLPNITFSAGSVFFYTDASFWFWTTSMPSNSSET